MVGNRPQVNIAGVSSPVIENNLRAVAVRILVEIRPEGCGRPCAGRQVGNRARVLGHAWLARGRRAGYGMTLDNHVIILHMNTPSIGQQFGKWIVIEYLGKLRYSKDY